MLSTIALRSLLACAVLSVVAFCWADEPQPAEVPATDTPALDAAATEEPSDPPVTEEEIAALIKQLDDDKFALRRAASNELQRIGRPAIEDIAKAAESQSLEVKSRAFDLLETFFKDGDATTKQAAKEALDKLAEGKGDVAARANSILTPMEELAETDQPRINAGGIQVLPGGRIQIQGGGIQLLPGNNNFRQQIQIQANGNGLKLKIANNNGNKKIEAEENGRKVKIEEDAAGKIKIEVTEKKGKKEETKKYEAKNAEELKKNEPEAYKLYDKYSQQNNIKLQGGAIQIFQGGNLQPGILPIPVPQGIPGNIPALPQGGPIPIPVLPNFAPNQQGNLPAKMQQRRIDALKQMKKALEKAQAIEQQQQGNAAPKQTAEHLERLEKEIEKAEAQLKIVDPLPEEAPAEEAVPVEEAPAEAAPEQEEAPAESVEQ